MGCQLLVMLGTCTAVESCLTFFFCERFLVQWVLIAANQTFQQPTVNALFTWCCTILGKAGILFCLFPLGGYGAVLFVKVL